MAELKLLDQPGEPMGAYLRQVLEQRGLLGDGSGGLVLPRLTGKTICQVYAGVCTEDIAAQVLESLLDRRPVWCPWEGLERTGRGPLAGLIRERLWTLRRSGLVLCPLGQLADWANHGQRGRNHGIGPGAGVYLVYPKIR